MYCLYWFHGCIFELNWVWNYVFNKNLSPFYQTYLLLIILNNKKVSIVKKHLFLYFCVFCARNIFLKLFSARSHCLLLLICLTTWVVYNIENKTKYHIIYVPIIGTYYNSNPERLKIVYGWNTLVFLLNISNELCYKFICTNKAL